MEKGGYVYILTNSTHSVLYTGVTNDIERRVSEHKQELFTGFTKKYKVKKLVYYEPYPDIEQAIAAEKQIKKGPRRRKISLIEHQNPEWRDLSEEWGW
jgi:putative endonuclease